jgi:hypothetical protein
MICIIGPFAVNVLETVHIPVERRHRFLGVENEPARGIGVERLLVAQELRI